MIVIEDLTKVYRLSKRKQKELNTQDSIKKAVNSVSLVAKPGEIYGLLGPNGAGKTTALRCIATLLKPTDGTITVCGHDTIKDSEIVRGKISFLTNEIKLDPQFSPRYMFDFFAKLYNVDKETADKKRDELFEYFEIKGFEDKKIEEFSTGMKQKAAIAVSLAHDSEVVIFDEPTSGLDIITARSVTEYLKVLREKGKTVIISTHIMSEAEKLCDRIGIIIHGIKVIEGTVEEILKHTDTSNLEDAFFVLYNRHSKEGTN